MLTKQQKAYFKDKHITIAMPAYNEGKIITQVVRSALKVLRKITSKYQVLVVNDGSTDKTGIILDELVKEDKHIRVIHFKKNKGVGNANFTIYKEAKGDFLFWNASDNQIHMDELFTMLPYVLDYDIVVGNRMARADGVLRKMSAKLFSFLIRLRFGVPVKDIDSVKVFRNSVFKKIKPQSRTAFIEAEILIKAKKKGLKIIEVPIKHYPRKHGKAKGIRLRIITPQLIELAKAFFRTNWD